MTEKLTEGERSALLAIIGALPPSISVSLKGELSDSKIEIVNPDRSIIEFVSVPDLGHRLGRSQNLLPVEGRVIDCDGELLSVLAYTDPDGRLFQFEVVRFAAGPVQSPVWNTFELLIAEGSNS